MLIRFKKNDGTEYPQWEKTKLKNTYSIGKAGGTPLASNYNFYDGNINFLSISDMSSSRKYIKSTEKHISEDGLNNSSAWLVDKNSLVLSMYASYGKVCINDIELATSQAIFAMKPINEISVEFMYQMLVQMKNNKYWEPFVKTGTQPNINKQIVENAIIYLPCLEEQQKIADFLSTVDQKIESQKTIVTDYEELKKGTMQKIFNQEIRFKNDDGNEFPEWEEKRLGDVLDISTKSNNGKCSKEEVLSVSDKFGVVNQIKLQGRSFAGDDISKYKVVETDDIIYTKSPLLEKPFGIIKIVKNEVGAVSPLYIVNKAKNGNYPLFIYYYFDSPSRTNNYLKPLIRKGAKNTMNISNEEWLSGKVKIPCFEEQKKIADFFDLMDIKIEAENKILADLEELKKGLLQALFNN